MSGNQLELTGGGTRLEKIYWPDSRASFPSCCHKGERWGERWGERVSPAPERKGFHLAIKWNIIAVYMYSLSSLDLQWAIWTITLLQIALLFRQHETSNTHWCTQNACMNPTHCILSDTLSLRCHSNLNVAFKSCEWKHLNFPPNIVKRFNARMRCFFHMEVNWKNTFCHISSSPVVTCGVTWPV